MEISRSEWAKVLLSVRARHPVSAEGIAKHYSISADKHTVGAHIEHNKAARRQWRGRGFA